MKSNRGTGCHGGEQMFKDIKIFIAFPFQTHIYDLWRSLSMLALDLPFGLRYLVSSNRFIHLHTPSPNSAGDQCPTMPVIHTVMYRQLNVLTKLHKF